MFNKSFITISLSYWAYSIERNAEILCLFGNYCCWKALLSTLLFFFVYFLINSFFVLTTFYFLFNFKLTELWDDFIDYFCSDFNWFKLKFSLICYWEFYDLFLLTLMVNFVSFNPLFTLEDISKSIFVNPESLYLF